MNRRYVPLGAPEVRSPTAHVALGFPTGRLVVQGLEFVETAGTGIVEVAEPII
jgi:hypothetical protein